jgi:hypothetical protein
MLLEGELASAIIFCTDMQLRVTVYTQPCNSNGLYAEFLVSLWEAQPDCTISMNIIPISLVLVPPPPPHTQI